MRRTRHLVVEPDRSTGEFLVTDYHQIGFTVLGRFATHHEALIFLSKVQREKARGSLYSRKRLEG